MNYSDAITEIEQIPIVDRAGLGNMRLLLEELGNPEKALRIIHVAGTNGKGSISSYISTILQAMGYRVGLFTSPYLERFNERIRLNGESIADEDFITVYAEVQAAIKRLSIEKKGFALSQFDVITACAYMYYLQKAPDFVVLEVGLGGALDSTNTCTPLVSVIASISIDHTEYLGNTIAQIANVKAGIIKPHIPVVLYEQSEEAQSVVLNRARNVSAPVYRTSFSDIHILEKSIYGQRLNLQLMGRIYRGMLLATPGEHQARNWVCALTAVLVLEEKGHVRALEDAVAYEAARNAKWNGRTELFTDKPVTILDGAHNAEGSEALARYIAEYLSEYYLIFVFGVLQDKEVDIITHNLLPLADEVVVTKPSIYRAVTAENLYREVYNKVRENVEVHISGSVADAVHYTQAKAEDRKGANIAVLYSGSLYLIGEARTALREYYQEKL